MLHAAEYTDTAFCHHGGYLPPRVYKGSSTSAGVRVYREIIVTLSSAPVYLHHVAQVWAPICSGNVYYHPAYNGTRTTFRSPGFPCRIQSCGLRSSVSLRGAAQSTHPTGLTKAISFRVPEGCANSASSHSPAMKKLRQFLTSNSTTGGSVCMSRPSRNQHTKTSTAFHMQIRLRMTRKAHNRS